MMINESILGGGGLVSESSAHLQAGESIGDIGTGNSSSANLSLNSGYTTTSDPSLSLNVIDGTLSFGAFSPGQTAVATSRFSISNYTSYGYTVQIVGTPPTNGNHTIKAMTTSNASQVGTEQYGINLVANTSPQAFGTNPDNGISGFGLAAPGYSTSNYYQYIDGNTVAYAGKSSGTTIYTVSHIINVTPLTPGGQYTAGQTLICIGNY